MSSSSDPIPVTRKGARLGLHPVLVALAAACAVVLAAPGHAAVAAEKAAVVWKQPTRPDGFRFDVSAGSTVTFTLKASASPLGEAVHIVPVSELPQGARASGAGVEVARSTFRWVPARAGDYIVRFRASTDGGLTAPPRTYTIHVRATAYRLADEKVGRFGLVLRPEVVRSAPSRTARAVAILQTGTVDGTQNLVLVLDGIEPAPGETWYRVRLPILPNNSTGWVPRSALGPLTTVHTHLYIDRARLRATLERDGRPVFTARIGVGKPYWPTPRGEFYVRSKLTNFDDPFYGPIAFGTSARSYVLTDWPGGGFIGIHGTSLPELLPGRVSHGCVRMRNEDIVRLARLMQVGAPITIL